MKISTTTRYLTVAIFSALTACQSDSDMLNENIPRLETPTAQFATIRIMKFNGRHVQTAFLDDQSRLLEAFDFGLSCGKLINHYEGDRKTWSMNYLHGDSDSPEHVSTRRVRYEYDQSGRLLAEHRTDKDWNYDDIQLIRYSYTPQGDTLKQKTHAKPDLRTRVDIDEWRVNARGLPTMNYRLWVDQHPRRHGPDTIILSRRRFSYLADGKLSMVCHDSAFNRSSYGVAGPDTVLYTYDQAGRLASKTYRYLTVLSDIDRPRTDRMQYHYERFDPDRHMPLAIPSTNWW
ncbi:hypothetical protein F7231_12140 [Fibrella aestuarina]|uniref:DUF4595 domain-containing protein n=1 Tax=Fibrivirga algicola TaxID=2950420 RepID=A0ABX0QFH1_9BACT|nr:hypothetical protein [Fibrivirga algicola]